MVTEDHNYRKTLLERADIWSKFNVCLTQKMETEAAKITQMFYG